MCWPCALQQALAEIGDRPPLADDRSRLRAANDWPNHDHARFRPEPEARGTLGPARDSRRGRRKQALCGGRPNAERVAFSFQASSVRGWIDAAAAVAGTPKGCRAVGRQCPRSPHGREPDRLHRRHFRFEVVSGGLLRGLRCSTVGPGVAHCRDGRPPFTLRLASLAHPTTAPRTRKPPSTAAQRTRSRSARLPSARPRSTPESPCPARSPAPALAAP